MNGGDNDDIIAALASTLENGKKLDARAAWKPTVAKPVASAVPTVTRKAVVKAATAKSWAQGFLFDISAIVQHEPALAGA
jgi:hypothetical protein